MIDWYEEVRMFVRPPQFFQVLKESYPRKKDLVGFLTKVSKWTNSAIILKFHPFFYSAKPKLKQFLMSTIIKSFHLGAELTLPPHDCHTFASPCSNNCKFRSGWIPLSGAEVMVTVQKIKEDYGTICRIPLPVWKRHDTCRFIWAVNHFDFSFAVKMSVSYCCVYGL